MKRALESTSFECYHAMFSKSEDVIKRDTDASFFFPYRLKKVDPTHSFQSDIDPSCSPGYCGFSFQHADDLADPLCWLKLLVLSILAGYLTNYFLESLSLGELHTSYMLVGPVPTTC